MRSRRDQIPVVSMSIDLKPRSKAPPPKVTKLREYLQLVLNVVSDLELSDLELAEVVARREQLRIGVEDMRAIHALVLGGMITRYAEDRRIDDRECENMRRLYACLQRLGWAPGT